VACNPLPQTTFGVPVGDLTFKLVQPFVRESFLLGYFERGLARAGDVGPISFLQKGSKAAFDDCSASLSVWFFGTDHLESSP
jgi:hypothetical protein